MKNLFTIVTLTFFVSDAFTVGDTIDNFTLDICENGEGVWEYHEEGTGNIVWMNLFTSW